MSELRRKYEHIRTGLIDKALRYAFENLVYCDEKTVQLVMGLYECFQKAEFRRTVRLYS